ncbi:HAMP domain-containing sensor histidine kinase [Caldibacillus debilis]|uniref:HAMP domain-containing sensor histidine kinase n=2 Tax=Caldibacillus debilis TaxID=301148 RepID=UPI000B549705|nr:HAMP domain-containing sensor histidine kinase [Caldibacillus debilis]OUM85146.1 MAG: two-component sensor histidine kinase [Caldibacillus debilis]
MFTRNKSKRIPLQRYWTTRYLLTLIVGLIAIALVSALWIRHTTLQHRLKMMELMAEEIANRIVLFNDGSLGLQGEIGGIMRGPGMALEGDPSFYIADARGTILYSNRPLGPAERRLHPLILKSDEEVQKLELGSTGSFYVVKKKAEVDSYVLGWVVFAAPEENLVKVNQEYGQLLIMITGLLLLGWAAIYFLSKRLSKPIKEVAKAARQVQEGNYDIELRDDAREEEIHDLIHSFKEMSKQLQQLEKLRNELLAGVTHELKTPVTSISGLLQAIADGVVTGDEAKEFLRISLKETAKMKKMVEDLLAFNSFVANAVPIQKEIRSLNELVEEIVRQWELVQEEDTVEVRIFPLKEDVRVDTDPIRLQQIFTNLLNNAKQAMDDGGKIDIRLAADDRHVTVDVIDTGSGIPEEELPFIFEKFFRGESKKYKVGGLGLGLPFSRLIAQALGGDLELVESSKEGTTFRITLPKV